MIFPNSHFIFWVRAIKMYLILLYHILFWKNDGYAGAVDLMLKVGLSKIGISLLVKFSECYVSELNELQIQTQFHARQ
jgi:hypothetical protein